MKHWTTALVFCGALFAILQVEGNSKTRQNGIRTLVEKHLSKRSLHHRGHHHRHYHHHHHHNHHTQHRHKHHKHHHHKHRHHTKHHHHHYQQHPHHLKRHHPFHHKSFHQKLLLKLKQQKERDARAAKYIYLLKQTRRDSLPQLLVSLGKGFLQLGTKLKNRPKPTSGTVAKQRSKAEMNDNPTVAPGVSTQTPTPLVRGDEENGDGIGDAALTKWQEPPTKSPVPARHTQSASSSTSPRPKIKIIQPKKSIQEIALMITPTPQSPTRTQQVLRKKDLKKFPSPQIIEKILNEKPKIPGLSKPAKKKPIKDRQKILPGLKTKSAKTEEAIPNKGVEIPPNNQNAMVPSPTESSIDYEEPSSEQFPQPEATFTPYELDSHTGTNIFVSEGPGEDSSSNNGQNIDSENLVNAETSQNEIGVQSPDPNTNIDSESVPPPKSIMEQSIVSKGHSESIDKTLGKNVKAQNLFKSAEDKDSLPIDKSQAAGIDEQHIATNSPQEDNAGPLDQSQAGDVSAQSMVYNNLPEGNALSSDQLHRSDVSGQNAASNSPQEENTLPNDLSLTEDINGQNVASNSPRERNALLIDQSHNIKGNNSPKSPALGQSTDDPGNEELKENTRASNIKVITKFKEPFAVSNSDKAANTENSNNAGSDGYYGKVITPAERDVPEPKPSVESDQSPFIKQNTSSEEEDDVKAGDVINDNSLPSTSSSNEVIVDGEVSPSSLPDVSDNNAQSKHQAEILKHSSKISAAPNFSNHSGPYRVMDFSENKTQAVTQKIEDGEVLPSQLYNSSSSDVHGYNDIIESATRESEANSVYRENGEVSDNVEKSSHDSTHKFQESPLKNDESSEFSNNFPQNEKNDILPRTTEQPITNSEKPYQDSSSSQIGSSLNHQSTTLPKDVSQDRNESNDDDSNITSQNKSRKSGVLSQNPVEAPPQYDNEPGPANAHQNGDIPLKDQGLNTGSLAIQKNGDAPLKDVSLKRVNTPIPQNFLANSSNFPQNDNTNEGFNHGNGILSQQSQTLPDGTPHWGDIPSKEFNKVHQNLSLSNSQEDPSPISQTQPDSNTEVGDAETWPGQPDVSNVSEMPLNATQPGQDDFSQTSNQALPRPQSTFQDTSNQALPRPQSTFQDTNGNQNDNLQPSVTSSMTSSSDDISIHSQDNNLNEAPNVAKVPTVNDPYTSSNDKR